MIALVSKFIHSRTFSTVADYFSILRSFFYDNPYLSDIERKKIIILTPTPYPIVRTVNNVPTYVLSGSIRSICWSITCNYYLSDILTYSNLWYSMYHHVHLVLTGKNFGTVLAQPLTGFLCQYGFDGGWPPYSMYLVSLLFYTVLNVFLLNERL